jgi:predicted aspartyl protease
MGRTVVKLKVANSHDEAKAEEGLIPESAVRRIEVEAMVDTGATYVCLPPADVAKLGLRFLRDVPIRTANGPTTRRLFEGARVELNDRDLPMPVMENDKHTPPLVGFLLLEAMDLVVDPRSQQVIGNPEHDGKWVADCF